MCLYKIIGSVLLASLVHSKGDHPPPLPAPGGHTLWKDYDTTHLDSALEHYETLHLNQLSSAPLEGGHRTISFHALGMTFNLHLQPDRSLFTKDFGVYTVGSDGHKHPYLIDKEAFMQGHLQGEEDSSSVSAHVSSNGVLSAVISRSDGLLYHIEPSHHYITKPHPFHMVAYSSSHVKPRLNDTKYDFAVPPKPHTHPSLEKSHVTNERGHENRRLRRQSVNQGNIGGDSCSLILIADYSAFQMFREDVDSASSQLVTLVSSMDKLIYRATDWIVDVNDNAIRELGHTIQEILVHTAAGPVGVNYTTSRDVAAGEILGAMRLEDWSGFCLAHLFTNRNFESGLLGLANIASPRREQTGGICSTRFNDGQDDVIYNTGLSTFNNNGLQMVLSEMIRVTGHELGHNWGSHHDPPTTGCGNRFLMNGFAQDGSQATHTEFSQCSRVSVGEVLLSKASCFMAPRPVCGDYQVDVDEECDVGVGGGDACCDSDCRLRPNALCSDRNSLCCKNCSVASEGVLCRNGLPLTSDCTGDTFCDGRSLDCAAPPRPLGNGTFCIGTNDTDVFGGVCITRETSPSGVQCIPLCTSINRTICTCSGEEECLVCCEEVGGGRCMPFDTTQNLTISNGAPCSNGVCIDGVCSDQTQDVISRIWTIITTLNVNAFGVFIRENIVGFVLIFTIPVWCLGGCIIHCVDVCRDREYQKSGANQVDVAQWYKKSLDYFHYHHKDVEESSDLTPFLSGKKTYQGFPIDPVDDMPLPSHEEYS